MSKAERKHIGRYDHVFPIWAGRGITVFAFDQRGFGRTGEGKGDKDKFKAYGKTSGKHQLEDAEWAIKHAREQTNGLPTFIMGHSMGGGIVLTFGSRTTAPPSPETVKHLSGVIASSPLILQAHPAPKIQRLIGGALSSISPNLMIPAPVKAEDLSHDKQVNEAYMKDPLVRFQGSLKGISDMLGGGEALLKSDYQHWPADLPLLLVHGTEDRVTSFKGSEQLFENLTAKDKTFTPYQGGYHELHNEPDGVKEKLIDECICWVEAHLPKPDAQNAKL
ncbi:lysophospholipase [Rickenella mellea]|uniref:Lysophospholipase n=1 Tax=Rickenella mellea TaxID=50990 RepID=A0A4Y7PNE6_9AGAM|nr:lysophospholipase [Rickenella mellea]